MGVTLRSVSGLVANVGRYFGYNKIGADLTVYDEDVVLLCNNLFYDVYNG